MERTVDDGKVKECIDKGNSSWYFKPCPFCGSTDIGVKDVTLDYIAGDAPCVARRKIWAFCKYCGAASPKTVRDVIGDDEEVAVAIVNWNKRKGE